MMHVLLLLLLLLLLRLLRRRRQRLWLHLFNERSRVNGARS